MTKIRQLLIYQTNLISTCEKVRNDLNFINKKISDVNEKKNKEKNIY